MTVRGTRRRVVHRPPREREQRELRLFLQLTLCSCAFVLLVMAKLLLPERVAPLREALAQAMGRNMDVQAVFSAVGNAFTGEPEDWLRAVFQTQDLPETAAAEHTTPNDTTAGDATADNHSTPDAGTTADTAAFSALTDQRRSTALETLREYRPRSAGTAGTTESTEAVPEGGDTTGDTPSPEAAQGGQTARYSGKALPDRVSMEQAILNFDYCTPVFGTLTSGFGYRDHPTEGENRFHYGIDLAAAAGTDILCFADGQIDAVGESASYGKYCVVSHAGGFSTLYAHCSRITVSAGTAVARGQKIAEVGSTGQSTGPHLHLELHQDGVYLNPIYYVSHG